MSSESLSSIPSHPVWGNIHVLSSQNSQLIWAQGYVREYEDLLCKPSYHYCYPPIFYLHIILLALQYFHHASAYLTSDYLRP